MITTVFTSKISSFLILSGRVKVNPRQYILLVIPISLVQSHELTRSSFSPYLKQRPRVSASIYVKVF